MSRFLALVPASRSRSTDASAKPETIPTLPASRGAIRSRAPSAGGMSAFRLRHALVNEDRIAVGIGDHERRGAVGLLVGLALELDAALLQHVLDLAHVLELLQRLPQVIPAR